VIELTDEKINDLLKGYRTEYPRLREYLQEELSKDNPSKNVYQDTFQELYLYELLHKTVLSLELRFRIPIIKQYFSANPKTFEQTAVELGVWPSTHFRRIKEGRKRILAIMNAKLASLEKEENQIKPDPCARNGQKTSHRYPASRAKPTKRQ
jgi:hypothetical protein